MEKCLHIVGVLPPVCFISRSEEASVLVMCVSFGRDGISFILDEFAAFYSIVMRGKAKSRFQKCSYIDTGHLLFYPLSQKSKAKSTTHKQKTIFSLK